MAFITVLIWLYDYNRFSKYDPNNLFHKTDSNPDVNFIMNVLWQIHCNSSVLDEQECDLSGRYRFDFVLSFFSIIAWAKLFISFRVT